MIGPDSKSPRALIRFFLDCKENVLNSSQNAVDLQKGGYSAKLSGRAPQACSNHHKGKII
jgi:hypothetical protein